MNALAAISLASDLLAAGLEIQSRLQAVNAVLTKARAEGRDVTEAELQELAKQDDFARERLQRLIDSAA